MSALDELTTLFESLNIDGSEGPVSDETEAEKLANLDADTVRKLEKYGFKFGKRAGLSALHHLFLEIFLNRSPELCLVRIDHPNDDDEYDEHAYPSSFAIFCSDDEDQAKARDAFDRLKAASPQREIGFNSKYQVLFSAYPDALEEDDDKLLQVHLKGKLRDIAEVLVFETGCAVDLSKVAKPDAKSSKTKVKAGSSKTAKSGKVAAAAGWGAGQTAVMEILLAVTEIGWKMVRRQGAGHNFIVLAKDEEDDAYSLDSLVAL